MAPPLAGSGSLGGISLTLFLLFVDGIGLGRRDPAVNVFLRARLPHLTDLMGGRPVIAESVPARGAHSFAVAVDAALGMPGLPQSATGQTAILTGVNAPQAISRHLNGYPTPRLRRILLAHSIFKQVRELGYSATFLNAYRPEFFRWLAATGGDPGAASPETLARIFGPAPGVGAEAGPLPPPGWSHRAARRYRPSASTLAVLAAGLRFRDLNDLREGRAVYHDITHATLRQQGYDLPLCRPEEAGRHGAAVAREHDFIMFEHFLTDIAGHARDPEQAIQVLENLDRFLGALLEGLDPARDTLLLISDHGNLEDLSVRTHTLNPVPGIAWGAGAEWLVGRIRDLTDVAPAILGWLRGGGPEQPDEPGTALSPSKG